MIHFFVSEYVYVVSNTNSKFQDMEIVQKLSSTGRYLKISRYWCFIYDPCSWVYVKARQEQSDALSTEAAVYGSTH